MNFKTGIVKSLFTCMTICLSFSFLLSITAKADGNYVDGPGRYSCTYNTQPFNSNMLNILNNGIYKGYERPQHKLGNCVTTEDKVTCLIEAIPDQDAIAVTLEISDLHSQTLTAIMYPTNCSAIGKFCRKVSINCNAYNYY